MIRLFSARLSRRRFLGVAATLLAAFLSACGRGETQPEETPTPAPEATSTPIPTETPEPTPTEAVETEALEAEPTPDPTPTPEPPQAVALWVAPDLEQLDSPLIASVVSLIRTISDALGFEMKEARSDSEADIALVPFAGDEDSGTVIYGEPLVPATAIDQVVNSISSQQLVQLFDGSISDWAELGGQDRAAHPVAHSRAGGAEFDAAERIEDGGEFGEIVSEHSGALALLPRSDMHFRFQTLIVDDVDPLRDELRTDTWPYWERISVRLGDDFEERFRGELSSALDEINEAAYRPKRTMMTVAGDVILGRTVHQIMVEQNDFLAPYRLVADELQRGDLTIGNLECALTDSFSPPSDPRTFSFMTFPEAVEGIRFAGFHAMSGANNHAMDFGAVGVRDTIAALESAGIAHFGSGMNLVEARQPCILEHNGVTFALLGYDSISMAYASAGPASGGIAPMIHDLVVEDITLAREQADVVIPYFHWGIEYVLTPEEPSRRMARAAIDAGADLVLGSHPHWVQGMEVYDGKAIFYSLSNFVFDQEWSVETKQGFILHLVFDGTTFAGFRIVPVLIEDYHRPRVVEDEVRSIILERFWRSTSIIAGTPLE